MKKILLIVVIIILVILGIGFCTGRKSAETSKTKVNYEEVNSELSAIDTNLSQKATNILSVWEDVDNDGSITKQEMKQILISTEKGVTEQKFESNTKEYTKKTYRDGLEAAKVISSYYKNSGDLKLIRNDLNTIKTELNLEKNKKSAMYESAIVLYSKMNNLVNLVSNPQGLFYEYRSNVYKNELS